MKDKLSALLDGDLDEQSARPVLDSIRRDQLLRAEWDAYCLIGDVLRGDGHGSTGFVDRVMAGIESAPTIVAPAAVSAAAAQGRGRVWRSLMPLAASVMGVAAVGWVAHTLYGDRSDVTRIAAAVQRAPVAVVPAAVRPVAAAADPSNVDPDREYVFVHQSMTGGGPIPGAIQHVRTVSDIRLDSPR